MPTSSGQLRRRPLRLAPRRGNTFTFSLVALVVVSGLAFTGWWFLGRGTGDTTPVFLTNTVVEGAYDYVVIEQGAVESATNTELRCEVRSRSGGGGGGGGGPGGGGGGTGGSSTTIIDVVPEGTMVKEGDLVVELDDSALKLEQNGQEIQVSNRRLLLAQAKNKLNAAMIVKKEYLQGVFVDQEKLIKSEVFKAEQTLRTAEQGLKSAKELAAKNIITGLQLEAAQFVVDDAKNLKDAAENRLKTLRELTKERTVSDHDANIKSAEADVEAQELSLKLELEKLQDIQDQIKKCKIYAAKPGQVVYANEYDMWRSSSSSQFVVTPGAMVRERQVIIRLPNADDMQIKATVNEARVTLIRPGLPVTIRVDALKDTVIEGVVTKVNQYAEPSGRSTATIKKYATLIKILNPVPELRVGMNAEVRIHVERKPSALQVPVQALAEVKGHYFTLVWNGDDYETREVKIGSSNDKVATIESGLSKNEVVVMNPRSAGSILKLPAIADPAPIVDGEIRRNAPGEVRLAGGPGEGKGGKGGGKGKGGGFNAATMVDRALESDEDKDGKLSVAEIGKMDERGKRWLEGADSNSDGLLERREMLTAAAAFAQRMREAGGKRGGGGPPEPAGGGE
ncbi:MAG TPA: HlyD family secretion protein [Pirellulaceae bacterium]|nr:HlyD family secretion protein [Pirellulaceae bacterium]